MGLASHFEDQPDVPETKADQRAKAQHLAERVPMPVGETTNYTPGTPSEGSMSVIGWFRQLSRVARPLCLFAL